MCLASCSTPAESRAFGYVPMNTSMPHRGRPAHGQTCASHVVGSWCQWTDQTMFCGQEKASHLLLTLFWQPAPLHPASQLEQQPVDLEKLELFLRNRKYLWSFKLTTEMRSVFLSSAGLFGAAWCWYAGGMRDVWGSPSLFG